MKLNIKFLTCICLVLLFGASNAVGFEENKNKTPGTFSDFDPLVDVEVTVEIQKIRAFDKEDKQFSPLPYKPILSKREYVDKTSDPDFFLKVIINDQEFTSDIWHDTKYIYNPQFSATQDVSDEEEFVDIKIQLWDWNENNNVLCDIGDDNDDIELTYNIKTGHWTGDDFVGDASGYGRASGCDDGTIYERDRDCELWFNIYQNDYDGDGIPYWTEVNDYGTNPEVSNSGEDEDNDDIPIEWEWRWGYDPFSKDNHKYLDYEGDSIENYEEYLTSQWYSDPFRKDIFIQMDYMETAPDGTICQLPETSKELLYTTWDRQNIVLHLDDGSWEGSASDEVPFDEVTNWDELDSIYLNYFVYNQEQWRRGVFHYGVVIYQNSWVSGNAFGSNRYQISAKGMEEKSNFPFFERTEVYASAYMHELGHTLGFRNIPGHNPFCQSPWQIGFWLNRPYRSCMNYGFMYYTVDYSDGSSIPPDLDDWTRMDLSYFDREWT